MTTKDIIIMCFQMLPVSILYAVMLYVLTAGIILIGG
mgnify:CR=1 FL=1|jgi:hypothetical protein